MYSLYMDISNSHNLPQSPQNKNGRYGIRVSVQADDPFAKLVGADWETVHWFASSTERDRVLIDMQQEHLYSRSGDRSTLIYQSIDN